MSVLLAHEERESPRVAGTRSVSSGTGIETHVSLTPRPQSVERGKERVGRPVDSEEGHARKEPQTLVVKVKE